MFKRESKKIVKRCTVVLAAAAMTTAALAGCSGGNTAQAGTTASAGESSNGATEVLFWHAMSGNTQTALQKVVDDFNAS